MNTGLTFGALSVVDACAIQNMTPEEQRKYIKEKIRNSKRFTCNFDIPKVPLIQKLNKRYTWDCETFLFEPLRSNCCEECGRGCKHISLDEWHKVKKLREGLKDNEEFDKLCNKILED